MHAVNILLVEDNPGDVDLTRETLDASALQTDLHVVEDGVLALEFLRRNGVYADAPRPDIVLLDLNIPRKDGITVLAQIKGDPKLRAIPVIVLTSSEAEADVFGSYDRGANCYITKPVELGQFESVVQSIEDYWLGTAKLPPRRRS